MRIPIAKAAAAGETPKDIYCYNRSYQSLSLSVSVSRSRKELVLRRTRSAKESNSWPIRLLLFRHLATLPSMKSKNKPKGMKANAAHRFALSVGLPKQYLMEEKMDMTPQNPGVQNHVS